MTLITLFATLTHKGILFNEKVEPATLKGKGTYVTNKGTYHTIKTLMIVKDSYANNIPSPTNPKLGYKIVCTEDDYSAAKSLLERKLREHLIKAELQLTALQNGLNLHWENESLIFKENEQGKKINRKRR